MVWMIMTNMNENIIVKKGQVINVYGVKEM